MTPKRWQQVKQIAGDALDVAPDARATFVDQACAGDSELHAEVSSLLMVEDASGNFLEPDRPLEKIGVYRVTREVGRGGMGAVYQGERADGQFEQRVAIKVIHHGMDTRAVLRRFFAERQILARLQHPNIARLLDGGVTSDGRPYFVMEYLDAEPILAYAKRHRLSIDKRLLLFLQVCDAVAYSHRRLVLHRDIKPGNILVDSDGVPKLLDFGIAKVLEEDGGAAPTEVGLRAMTPQYASPEQMRGEPLTTASDVYGLGLLLYELLMEQTPYDVPVSGPATQLKVVVEQEPRRPNLRSDLDNIVLKALEKDPARRYATADELATDLQRFRARLPVRARSATLGYRVQKYAVRHWKSLAVAAVVVIVLSAAIANALIQGRRAQRRFDEIRKISNSFMFEFHDAIANLPGSTPARELVIKRALQYLDGLEKDAAGDVDLKRELAESYLRIGQIQGLVHEANLGQTEDARASLLKAQQLLKDVVRSRPRDPRGPMQLARTDLSLSVAYRGDPRSESYRMEARALLLDLAAQHPDNPRLQFALAQSYFGEAEMKGDAGKPAEALEPRNKSIELFRKAIAGNPKDEESRRMLAQSLKRRAATYFRLNDYDKAIADLNEATPMDEARIAKDPTSAVAKLDLALTQAYLSVILRNKGDLDGAGQLLDRAMATRAELLRADPRNLRLRTLAMGDFSSLAALRRAQKRLPESNDAIKKGFALADAADSSVADNSELKSARAKLQGELALTAAAQRRP